ncbi:MAG TPA: hypothetical protein ENK31_08350 [Nannocystis exedens]|nr:hypothetical protein [Nannocystis exedens]
MTIKTDFVSVRRAAETVDSGTFFRDMAVHRLTPTEVLLLFVGGAMLALAAAAGGNYLGIAACTMDDATMQRVSASLISVDRDRS